MALEVYDVCVNYSIENVKEGEKQSKKVCLGIFDEVDFTKLESEAEKEKKKISAGQKYTIAKIKEYIIEVKKI